jgi:hypothetical protein
MNLFKNTITALTLTVAAFGATADAGSSNPLRDAAAAEVMWASRSNVNFEFENDFAARLDRGDSDLFTYSNNPAWYRAFVEYEVVQGRYIYCTVTCDVEETLGSTKFSFPSTSRLVFDAGPRATIYQFKVDGELYHGDYALIQSQRSDRNWNGHVPATIGLGDITVRGDRWGHDRQMFWKMDGHITRVYFTVPKYTEAQLDAMFPPIPRSLVNAGNRYFRR